MPPLLLMAARCLIAGGVLFAWAAFREPRGGASRHWGSAAASGALLFLGGQGLLAVGQRTVPSGTASLVMATIPVWLVLLEAISGGPRPRTATLLGLGLGLSGLLVLVGPGRATPGPGLAVLVGSAFAWAAGSILSRRLPHPASLVRTSGMQFLCGGAALGVVGLAAGEWAQLGPAALAPRALAAFAYMVLAASLVGFTAYTWLLRVSTPSRVGTYAFVNPVVALLLGATVAGERMDARTVAASVVILGGVALVVTSRAPASADPEDAAPSG
jgi:drug/metabolite transporter (DMT)-like permease